MPSSTPARLGVAMRCERLTMALSVSNGTVVIGLTGALDRQARASFLRAVRRVARSSTGALLVDCQELTAWDEAGLDALASVSRLPGVRSVRLVHVDPDLGRRLDEAGLARRLGIAPTVAPPGASSATASGG